MKMGYHIFLLFVLIFLSFPLSRSWDWFSSSSDPPSETPLSGTQTISKGLVAEFSMNALDDPKAAKLIENARKKLGGSNPCWLRAYQDLFSSCSGILAVEEKRKRLAWKLSDCFLKDTGRDALPHCSEKTVMVDCLSKLSNDDQKTYLEFYLQTNSICHQLQSEAFKFQLENLVNDLKNAAQNAEDKLVTIEEKSDNLLHTSSQMQQSIASIDTHSRHIGETLKNMLDYTNVVLKNSKELNEQAKGITSSQVELLNGQGILREKIQQNMAKVEESYDNLGHEIESLQKKAVNVIKEMNKVGEVMFSNMQNLQGKADDIASMAEISVDKQHELLQSQSKALHGVESLTAFMSESLQESRICLQEMVNFANGQHQELLKQQEQIQKAHSHLANNSRSILAAQEALKSKQTSMLVSIDKLFALHNAMLLESRLLKALFVYFVLIIVLYVLTSTKQTYAARCRLYIGLCITFATECAILRYITTASEQHLQLRTIMKQLFGVYAIIQLLYSILTYRDYEALNHKMLASLIDKVNGMRKGEDYCWDDDDGEESEIDWLSWMEVELPEEVDIKEDPDFMLPGPTDEVVQKSFFTTTDRRRYNLRRRH